MRILSSHLTMQYIARTCLRTGTNIFKIGSLPSKKSSLWEISWSLCGIINPANNMSLTDKLHINTLVIVRSFFIFITQYTTSPLLRTANRSMTAIIITNSNMPTLIMFCHNITVWSLWNSWKPLTASAYISIAQN